MSTACFVEIASPSGFNSPYKKDLEQKNGLAFVLKHKNNYGKLLSACILLHAAVFFCAPSSEAKQLQPAVLLKEHSGMQGDVDVLVGRTGVNVYFRKSGMALIMGSPNWDVIYANMQAKRYYQCRSDQWKVGPAVFSAMFRPSSPTSLRLTTSKKTTLKGLPCEVHQMETREASRGTDKTWKRLMPKDGRIWLYPQAGFPRQCYQMVANLLAIPQGPGIPVAMEFSKYDGEILKEISLYGFENKQSDGSEFIAPKGFQRVTSQADVLNKGVESKDFADFLNEK